MTSADTRVSTRPLYSYNCPISSPAMALPQSIVAYLLFHSRELLSTKLQRELTFC